jgi:hypothetical protein
MDFDYFKGVKQCLKLISNKGFSPHVTPSDKLAIAAILSFH